MTCSAVTAAATSIIGISTSWPSPVRARCSSAATSASAVCVPTIGSTTPPGMIGGPSSYPVQPGHPGDLLHRLREPAAVAPRPLEPERGQPQHHHARVDRADVVVGEPEPLHHRRREVLGDDVGRRDQPLREREPVGVAEVERDPALAEVGRVPQRRHLVEARLLLRPDRRVEPQAVGPLHRLDLDHLRAHRAQPRRRERSRPERGEVEHPQPRERPLPDLAARPDFVVRESTRPGGVRTQSRRCAADGRASASSRSATAEKRNGARGRIHDSPGWVTNAPRAFGCANSRQQRTVADDRGRHPRRRARPRPPPRRCAAT